MNVNIQYQIMNTVEWGINRSTCNIYSNSILIFLKQWSISSIYSSLLIIFPYRQVKQWIIHLQWDDRKMIISMISSIILTVEIYYKQCKYFINSVLFFSIYFRLRGRELFLQLLTPKLITWIIHKSNKLALTWKISQNNSDLIMIRKIF